MKNSLLLPVFVVGAFLALNTHVAHAQFGKKLCKPGAGAYNGLFYSWFELSQENINDCDTRLELYKNDGRHFRATWDMAKSWGEDAVGGMGWRYGGKTRKFGYNIGELTTNSDIQKALIGIYGWSCYKSGRKEISQEYYIVDTWKGPGKFVPWDENAGAPAKSKGTVKANGATYDVYKVRRNGAQFCFNGANKSFDQFWSVRRSPTQIGKNHSIDFKPHSNRWDNNDLRFQPNGVPSGYQIFAAEIFGDANLRHKGAIDATVWWRGN